MEEFNKKIQGVQDKLQEEIKTGTLGQTIKQCEKEKTLYETVAKKVGKLSEDIQGYIKKFDDIKDEINTSGKKFENYKMEIENKKLQI